MRVPGGGLLDPQAPLAQEPFAAGETRGCEAAPLGLAACEAALCVAALSDAAPFETCT
jgi:hypothetical protein